MQTPIGQIFFAQRSALAMYSQSIMEGSGYTWDKGRDVRERWLDLQQALVQAMLWQHDEIVRLRNALAMCAMIAADPELCDNGQPASAIDRVEMIEEQCNAVLAFKGAPDGFRPHEADAVAADRLPEPVR